jgi:beta-catenin-like protein 1
LSHENTDIVLNAISILSEFSDIDFLIESRATHFIKLLVFLLKKANSFFQVDLKGPELLVANLPKLKEQKKDDASGIFKILSTLENIIDMEPHLSNSIYKNTDIIAYLLNRLSDLESAFKKHQKTQQNPKNTLNIEISQNLLFCSELFSIFLQNSEYVNEFIKSAHFERILVLLNYFRLIQVYSQEHVEFINNLTNSMCAALLVPHAQTVFRKIAAFELMFKLMK